MSDADIHDPFDTVSVGDTFSFTETLSADVIETFERLSGDYSPIHANDEYAAGTVYKKRIVHGMLLGAYVSRLVGMYLSNEDRVFVCMKVALEFKQPLYIGETITLTGTIKTKSTSVRLVELALSFERDSVVVCTGSAYAKLLE